jgi:Asp-tRNA(Asn)/Glu-tRNA(Gln) amidotransferase B subunit
MLAELVTLVQQGTINHSGAKELLETLYTEGGDPARLVKERGLAQVSDEAVLGDTVVGVIEAHPDEVARYLAGEEKLAKFLMGMVMRELRGKGDAAVVQRLLTEHLEQRR